MFRDQELFSVPEDEIGRTISKIVLIAYFWSILAALMAGYFYDLAGRKPLILLYLFLQSIGCFLIPRTAPSIELFTVVRAFTQMLGVSLLSHPLVNDYVKKESRGKAVAIIGFGTLAGEAFAIVVLFGFTKRMEITQAFNITSFILLVMSLFALYCVTEPVIKAKQNKNPGENSRLLQRNESITFDEATAGMSKY